VSNPGSQNNLPPPLKNLNSYEVFLFTRIPLHLIEGFINGTFKPNREHREKLSNLSRKFFRWDEAKIRACIEEKKYETLRCFLSPEEKENLLLLVNQPDKNKYSQKLNELLLKYLEPILRGVPK